MTCHASCGCSAGASCCLSCPLPACVWGAAAPLKTERRVGGTPERDAMIRLSVNAGASAAEVGRRYGVSKRSVYRIVGG